ncbi:DNA primase [bacterium HR36]|nr:DNA primase [bacterium HR36]
MAGDLIAQVKQANDIVEVVREYLPLRRQGRTYKGLCPFHDDHHPSLDVDPVRQRFRCWACGKYGDVITFVQERERCSFREAVEILARRAGLAVHWGQPQRDQERSAWYDLLRWAEEQYRKCLWESSVVAVARQYLQERGLRRETLLEFGVGFAPDQWDWLTQRAMKVGWTAEQLVTLGLCGQREQDGKLYDRFRGRIMFPIRDVRGRTVGFGGRILPGAESQAHAPKYYNSTDTPLFRKSEHLYGLDRARAAAEEEGYLAVVEGYTDVLMAHQHGCRAVVATLGTALNEAHLQQLRRFVPRVVLVFDADSGGHRGVELALQLFLQHDVELRIVQLPAEFDPCDFLLAHGREAFAQLLTEAVDALEFKLRQELTPHALATLEGRRQAIDNVLRLLAQLPANPSGVTQVKRELAISQLARRAGANETTLWWRLQELYRQAHKIATPPTSAPLPIRLDPLERQLLEIFLAEPALLAEYRSHWRLEHIEHRGIRQVLAKMLQLVSVGIEPTVDRLRQEFSHHPRLSTYLLQLHDRGLALSDRRACLEQLLQALQERQAQRQREQLRQQLQKIAADAPPPADLLRKFQEHRPLPRPS